MLRRSSLAFVCLAAAAVGVGAWLAFGSRERTGPSSDSGTDADAGGPSAPSEASDAAALAAGGRKPDAGPKSGGGGTIVGVVRRVGKPTAAHVEARILNSRASRFDESAAARLRATTARLESRTAAGAAVAGPDGRFEIHGLVRGAFAAVAWSDDGAAGSADVRIGADGATATTAIDLLPASAPLHGRARYADGRAFSGLVVVRPSDGVAAQRDDEAVRPDAEGRFVVTGLPAGRCWARFVVPGEIDYGVSGPTLPMEGEWDVVVDGRTDTIAGRVVEAAGGAPIAGAVVVVNSWGGWSRRLSAITKSRDDGAFAVTSAPDSSNSLTVAADGYATVVLQRPVSPQTVRLQRCAILGGVVRRAADGSPVVGAAVRVVQILASGWTTFAAEGTTGPDGRYEIGGLPPTDVAVFAAAPGLACALSDYAFHSGWPDSAVSLSPGERATFDLSLVQTGSIAGRVTDSDGNPATDAVVTVGNLAGQGSMTIDPAFGDRASAVAADGSFLIEGLATTLAISLLATTPDGRLASSSTVGAGVGEPTRVEIRLPAAVAIDVTVIEAATGKPLADVAVSTGGRADAARTDERGRASVRTSAAREQNAIGVRAPGFATAQRLIPKGETSVEFRLAAGRSILGRVERADGTPVAGAFLNAIPSAGGVPAYAQSADDGSFRLDGFDDVSISVSANASIGGAQWSGSATGRPGAPMVIRLAEAGVAAGAVPPLVVSVADEQGNRVMRAQLRAKAGTADGLYFLDDGGSVRIPRSKREPTTVEVWAALDEFGRPMGLAPGRAEAGPDADALVVTLRPGATIDGVVLGPDGKPVRGVIVGATWPSSVAAAQSGAAHRALATTRTGPDGTFHLTGLPPDADLRLFAQPPTGMSSPTPVPGRSGAKGVELRLRAGVQPSITVLDPDGSPVPNISVVVVTLRDDGTPWLGEGNVTAAGGVVRCRVLDPERSYRVEVNNDSRADFGPVVVELWKPHDDVIRLPRAREVAGVVVDAAGGPIAGAIVGRAVAGSPGTTAESTTDVDGRFRLARTVDGPLTITARASGFVPRDVTVDVSASLGPVTIALDAGREARVRIDGWTGGAKSWLTAIDESRSTDYRQPSGEVGADGLAVIKGVEFGRSYTLWMRAQEGSDLYLLARGIRLSDGETHVALSRGGSIRGRAVLPPGIASLSVSARSGPLSLFTSISPEGDFEFRGVPPGVFRVAVWGYAGEASWRGVADASAGDVVTMKLEPKD